MLVCIYVMAVLLGLCLFTMCTLGASADHTILVCSSSVLMLPFPSSDPGGRISVPKHVSSNRGPDFDTLSVLDMC